MGIHSTPLLLIVEDDWEFYNHLSQILESKGYEVCAFAPTYEEGLALFNSAKPSAVLMDIELRGVLNGLQLAQEIRKTSDLPIIYLSNLHSDSVLTAASLTSPHDYLIKGKISDMHQILATLKMTLGKSKIAQPLKVKDGVMGLIGYKQNLTLSEKEQVHTIPVTYRDILYFSTEDLEVKKGATVEKIKIQENYCWFLARIQAEPNREGVLKTLMLETSLTQLKRQLPAYFERINQKTIVNLSAGVFEGLVQGSASVTRTGAMTSKDKPLLTTEDKDLKKMQVKVAGKVFVVTETYKKIVEDKLKELYLKF